MGYLFVIMSFMWATCAFALETTQPISTSNQSVIEGTLLQVSKLPPPQGNPYPDCYYTATVDIAHIASGKSIPQKVILVLPGFFSRQYAPEAKFKTGDIVRATVVPFASTSDNVKQTQQADEIEDVDLDFYFPEKVELIQEFQKITSPVPFPEKLQKTEKPGKLKPVDIKAREARQEAMRHDLNEINRLLAEHGGDWDKWYDSQKPFRDQYKAQHDAKAHKWIGNSFFSAGLMALDKVYSSEFVRSIIAFNKYLAARNVDLILVRVPYKGEIVNDLFTSVPPDQVTNPYLLRLYKELLEADIEIIADIIPRAKEARLNYPLMYWYRDYHEAHPAEGIAWVVAEAFAERLNRYEKIRNQTKGSFQLRQVSTAMDLSNWLWSDQKYSPLWPEGNPKFNPKEHMQFSGVFSNEGKAVGRKSGSDSPVLMVGSSFTEFPSVRLGATIPSYLTYLTGVVPDIYSRNAADAGIPRMLAREGDTFLEHRSVCVFPLVATTFYNGLDLAPIFDPAIVNKVLLKTYVGNDLQNRIQFAAGTSKEIYTYSTDGSLSIQAPTATARIGIKFSFALPQQISEFTFFMIEIESSPGDAAVFNVSNSNQTSTIHKSYQQKNADDFLIFETSGTYIANFHIGNVRKDVPTVIKSIKIYGVRP